MKEHFPSSGCWEMHARESEHYAREIASHPLSPAFLTALQDFDSTTIPPEDVQVFYELRDQVELQESGMNYRRYAQKLWDHFIGAQYREEQKHKDLYVQFYINLVRAHVEHVPIRDLLYITEHMLDRFVAEILPSTDRVFMWSEGEPMYQHHKIWMTGLVQGVQERVKDVMEHSGENAASSELASKLGYIVDRQKKGLFFTEVKALNEDPETQGRRKVVVLDDRVRNLKSLEDHIQASGWDTIKFIPIWAAYSREGAARRKEVEEGQLTEREYQDMLEHYNAVLSPSALFDERKDLFKDAVVFLDFDGVMIDNALQRIYQSMIKYVDIKITKEALRERGEQLP